MNAGEICNREVVIVARDTGVYMVREQDGLAEVLRAMREHGVRR